jgi:hypothetical protein
VDQANLPPDFGRNLFGSGAIAMVVKDDIRAIAREPKADGPADSSRSSGY